MSSPHDADACDADACDACRYLLVGMRLTLPQATALTLIIAGEPTAAGLARTMYGSTRRRSRASAIIGRLAERGLVQRRPYSIRWQPTAAGRRYFERLAHEPTS